MADPKSPLDELNSALDGASIPETAPDATPQGEADVDMQNTETQEGVTIGGRVWTSVEDLDKAWRSLQGDHTKKSQALAAREQEYKKYQEEHKEAIEMAQYFKAHPEIHAKVAQYFQKVKSGDETPSEAIKSSGLSRQPDEAKAYLERIAKLEKAEAERQAEKQEALVNQATQELDAQIEDLRKTYKLDDDKLEQILKEAMKFNKNLDAEDDAVPLRDIFLMLNAKHAWRKAAKASDNVLPTPRSETIDPTSAPKARTPEDEFIRSLDKMGI